MNRKTIAISGLTLALFGAGGFLFYKSKRPKDTAARERLEAALKEMKVQQGSPLQEPFRRKDFAALKAGLIDAQDPSQRIPQIQAGIVFFDTGSGKDWTPEETSRFAVELLEKASDKTRGKDHARARVLTFQLLRRLAPRVSDERFTSSLESALKTKTSDAYELNLYLDLASLLPEPPPAFAAKLKECLGGKDLGLAQGCLSIAEQIVNAEVRQDVVKHVLQAIAKSKPEIQPFMAKTVFAQASAFPEEAEKWLEAASRKEDETWQDVFIYGVSRMNQVDRYRSRLADISRISPSPTARQRAQSLLQ